MLELARQQDVFIRTTFQRRLGFRETEQRRLAMQDGTVGILPAAQLTSEEARQLQYENLEDLVGRTPLLGLIAPHGSLILAKLESQNPTESHYDRVYVTMLRELERRKVINPGDDLYEVTSGSAGISFAWACSRLGYKAHIFVPKGTPIGRNQEMINFGADLIEAESENVPGASLAERLQFIRIARSRGLQPVQYIPNDGMFHSWMAPSEEGPGMFMVNHSENHFTHHTVEEVGREVAAIVPAYMSIDYFVSILGNGTNTRGISDGLRRRFKNHKIIGVEDVGNPVQFEKKYPGRFEEIYGHAPVYERQQMLGSSQRGLNVSFIDGNAIEDIQLVSPEEWQAQLNAYNAREGKYTLHAETIGRTTAASLVVAKRLDEEHPGSVILMVFYDKGDRYDELRKAPAGHEITFATSPTAEGSVTQPPYWLQWPAASFDDLPADLYTAYQGREIVEIFNRRRTAYRKVA